MQRCGNAVIGMSTDAEARGNAGGSGHTDAALVAMYAGLSVGMQQRRGTLGCTVSVELKFLVACLHLSLLRAFVELCYRP